MDCSSALSIKSRDARRDDRKVLRQERDERIVLRPLRERLEQRVHARLALVERERLLLGAQLARLAVEEIKRHGDRPQATLTRGKQCIRREQHLRLAVRQFAPVRRDAHSVHIRQLRQRQRDAVVSERQVDARQARILCAQVDLRAAARHLERLERRFLRDGRRERRLVGPCEQRLQ